VHSKYSVPSHKKKHAAFQFWFSSPDEHKGMWVELALLPRLLPKPYFDWDLSGAQALHCTGWKWKITEVSVDLPSSQAVGQHVFFFHGCEAKPPLSQNTGQWSGDCFAPLWP